MISARSRSSPIRVGPERTWSGPGCNSSSPWSRRATSRTCSCGDSIASDLNDLGEVTVISDPGRSGKDMERAGLQQLLAMVEAGHVSHVLLWRLDRLRSE